MVKACFCCHRIAATGRWVIVALDLILRKRFSGEAEFLKNVWGQTVA
jgi:hypothetical protein